jgi:hypothetical protein
MTKPNATAPSRIDLHDEEGLTYWRNEFGVTTEQLHEAVQAVGGQPGAVREHLLNQGASAGAS